jgi:hypothetical protein
LCTAVAFAAGFGQIGRADLANLSPLGLGACGACLAGPEVASFVVCWVRAMAVKASRWAVVGGWGRAVIGMFLFCMLRRATETAAGLASAGPWVVPLPASVALNHFFFSRQRLGIGDNTEQA